MVLMLQKFFSKYGKMEIGIMLREIPIPLIQTMFFIYLQLKPGIVLRGLMNCRPGLLTMRMIMRQKKLPRFGMAATGLIRKDFLTNMMATKIQF